MKSLKPSYNGRTIFIEPTGFEDYSGEEFQARVHLSPGPEGCRFAYGATEAAAEEALRARLAQEKADQNEKLLKGEGKL